MLSSNRSAPRVSKNRVSKNEERYCPQAADIYFVFVISVLDFN